MPLRYCGLAALASFMLPRGLAGARPGGLASSSLSRPPPPPLLLLDASAERSGCAMRATGAGSPSLPSSLGDEAAATAACERFMPREPDGGRSGEADETATTMQRRGGPRDGLQCGARGAREDRRRRGVSEMKGSKAAVALPSRSMRARRLSPPAGCPRAQVVCARRRRA
jgi:hypothetical protein